MKLSEVAFDDIKIGMRVVSDSTGNKGKVVKILTQVEANDREDNVIYIGWDNGNKSPHVWHFWCDKVTVL